MKNDADPKRRYPTDLTDAQFALIEPLLPAAKPRGRPRRVVVRAVVNAILYLLRTGCAWRMLPRDFPPWGTVHYYFRRWRLEGVWARIHHALLTADRERMGRQPSPTAAIIDSQSVRTGDQRGGERGFDAGKKVNGRKRHILTDTDGRLLAAKVHAGNVQDRDGAKPLLKSARRLFPWIGCIFADGGSAGRLERWVLRTGGWSLEIVRRRPETVGFEVLPRRWVIERTFAWIAKQRRLVHDYEQLPVVSEALLKLAATSIFLKRLTL